MDETPLIFNAIPNDTVAKKGTESIIIKTFEQEKFSISALKLLKIIAPFCSFDTILY